MADDAEPGGLETLPRRPSGIRNKLTDRWRGLPANVRGGILIIYAGFFFAIMTALIKLAGQTYHVTQILFIRQFFMFVIVSPSILRGFPGSLRTKRPGLQLARVTCALIAMICGFTAFIHMPLADAAALGFAKSFFITIFAILILQEVVGWRRWTATIVGFVGVLVMLRPDTGTIDIYGLLAVAGAAGAGMVMIIIRLLSRVDQPITILTWQVVMVGTAMALPAYYYWITPTWADLLIFAAIGVVSYIAQMANIRAFSLGEATAIAALDYTRLIHATVLGLLIFSDLPSLHTIIGAVIILSASFYTIRREAQHGKKLARSAEGRGYGN